MDMTTIPRENVTVDGTDVQWSPTHGRPLLLLLRMASRGMGVWEPAWDGLAARFSVAQFDLGMPSSQPRFAAEHFDRVDAWVRARLAGDRFLELDTSRALKWIRALRVPSVSDAELAAVRVPTLVVAHGEDRWHAGPTVDMARNLAARLPAATCEVLEGFGSLVLLEAPQVFLAAADPFYARQLAALQ